MIKLLCTFPIILLAAVSLAATNIVVQVSTDGSETIPAGTIALPAQVSAIEATAAAAKTVGELALERAEECAEKVALYSTNFLVSSTVYVQSIGAVAYDPSNQTINVQSFLVDGDTVQIIGTVKQVPLVTPVLDWRQTLGTSGVFSNISATVTSVEIPAGVTNAAAAYMFTVPKPSGASAYFRITDNSTGASGSGLYWVIFGGVNVDGHKGKNGIITNIVGSVTNFYRVVGGSVVEWEPLGDL